MRHAYENVRFYGQLYRKAGVHPSDIRTLDDIRKLPVVTKEEMRHARLEDRVTTLSNLERCLVRHTSGSTGSPLEIIEEEKCVDVMHAYILRRLVACGLRPWDRTAVLGSTPMFMKGGIMSVIRDHRVKVFNIKDDVKGHVLFLNSWRPGAVWAPASHLRLMAENSKRWRLRGIRPRMILTSGEHIDAVTRNFVETTFGGEVFAAYGCNEVAPLGGIGWECPVHEGYHVNSELVIVEFLSSLEPVGPGEQGDVVATSLFKYRNPFIRYKIGDVGTPLEELCSCGRGLPLMGPVQGRAVDFLVMPDGRLVSPYSTIFALEKIPGINRFQVIQEREDEILVLVETSVEEPEAIEREVERSLKAVTSPRIAIRPKIVEKMPVTLGKKFRLVTSKIAPAIRSDRSFYDAS